MKKITILGCITGFVFTLYSAFRYWTLYPDLDKLIAYVTIGLLILFVSWLYNLNRNLSEQVEKNEIILTSIEDHAQEDRERIIKLEKETA